MQTNNNEMRDIYDGGKFERQFCILPILLRYDCPDSRYGNSAGGLRGDLRLCAEWDRAADGQLAAQDGILLCQAAH